MSPRRLRALTRKEFAQILRDPSSLAIAFVMPALLLFLFGYGVSLDPRQVRLALVMPESSPRAESFAGAFEANPWFEPVLLRSRQEGEAALARGEVRGIVALHEDFAARLEGLSPGPPVQLLLDGADANTARLLTGYVDRLWTQWLAYRAAEGARVPAPVVDLIPRIWFNPEVRSENFLIPGLLGVILTLTGALLTSLLVAREHDRGTIETLLVSPASPGEILIAKMAPSFALGMGALAFSLAMSAWLFAVPIAGSLPAVFAVGAVFLLATLGMGMLISVTTRNQFVAGQMALMTTFLPAFLLSGMIFEIASMPGWVQALTRIVAARYLTEAYQTLFLVGDVWPILARDVAALLAMAAVFLGASRALMRKRLD
ncbi:MAG: ABC transporter permease [Pseudomonadota bacterium]